MRNFKEADPELQLGVIKNCSFKRGLTKKKLVTWQASIACLALSQQMALFCYGLLFSEYKPTAKLLNNYLAKKIQIIYPKFSLITLIFYARINPSRLHARSKVLAKLGAAAEENAAFRLLDKSSFG